MNSVQRLRTALLHREPDMVPVDLGSHRSSGLSVQAYKRLREYLGLPASRLYVYDVLQQLAVVEDDVLDIFGVDVVQLGYRSYLDDSYWKPFRLHDGTDCMVPAHINICEHPNGDYYIVNAAGRETCIQKRGCYYFEQTCFPLADYDGDFSDLEERLQDVMWFSVTTPPAPYSLDAGSDRYIGDMARSLRAETDRAIYGIFGGNLLETGQQAFRMDNMLMEMAAEPERIHTFLDALLSMHMRNLKRYLAAVGEYIDVIGFGDDLGMQTGPQLSVTMFDEFFAPRYKTMWSYVHENYPQLSICMHTCGGIEPLLPSLIDAGLNCMNPVQISCAGMEPSGLKRKYGDRMVFWGGGCDTQSVLRGDSLQRIAENVHENMEIFKRGGGFVFQQVHNILADVPPQNVVAMFEAVKKYRSCAK